MKKTKIAMLLTMLVVVCSSFSVFGAASIVNGLKVVSGAMVFNDETGEAVKAESDGTKLNMNNLEVNLVTGPASRIGLPSELSNTITAINRGDSLADTVKGVDLTDYKALIQTSTITIKDKVTGKEVKTSVIIEVYVPNLIAGLKGVQVLFYDNETGKWSLLNPENIDFVNKRLSVKITGSGTFTIVYKS